MRWRGRRGYEVKMDGEKDGERYGVGGREPVGVL